MIISKFVYMKATGMKTNLNVMKLPRPSGARDLPINTNAQNHGTNWQSRDYVYTKLWRYSPCVHLLSDDLEEREEGTTGSKIL